MIFLMILVQCRPELGHFFHEVVILEWTLESVIQYKSNLGNKYYNSLFMMSIKMGKVFLIHHNYDSYDKFQTVKSFVFVARRIFVFYTIIQAVSLIRLLLFLLLTCNINPGS